MVWDKVRDYLAASGTRSNTHDLHAVYERFGPELNNLSHIFPIKAGQVGAICGVGSNIFAELFADPELLEDRYDQLLRSTLIEALVHPGNFVVTKDRIEGFLPDVSRVSVNSRVVQSSSLQSTGRTLVFSGRGIAGSALLDDGRVIHLSAHQKCLGGSAPFEDQLSDLQREKEDWQRINDNLVAELEKDYARRRKTYRSFKSQLAPVQGRKPQPGEFNSFEETGSPPVESDRPTPLSESLHSFFLDLFRRD